MARDARVAVVLRRGPTKRVQMLRWDLATDRVTDGQWLSGRVYEGKCAVSPDGELFVYFAAKFKLGADSLYSYTVVCRPPWFTALALWPSRDTYGGGGFFDGPRSLVLNYNMNIPLLHGAKPPHQIRVTNHGAWREAVTDPRVAACAQDGWSLVAPGAPAARTRDMFVPYVPPRVDVKENPGRHGEHIERALLGYGERGGAFVVYRYRLVRTTRGGRSERELRRADCAEWDHDGSLLYAEGGCLYRQRDPDRPATLVADLRDRRVSSVRSPQWAKEWP